MKVQLSKRTWYTGVGLYIKELKYKDRVKTARGVSFTIYECTYTVYDT